MSTILWQYEKKIDIFKAKKIILTGLFLPCSCQSCLNFKVISINPDTFSIYQVGSSNLFLQLRGCSNHNLDCYYSFYNGCPNDEGYIILGGVEEVLNNLSSLDQDIILFNLDLFK
jgi:hypothetical protein